MCTQREGSQQADDAKWSSGSLISCRDISH